MITRLLLVFFLAGAVVFPSAAWCRPEGKAAGATNKTRPAAKAARLTPLASKLPGDFVAFDCRQPLSGVPVETLLDRVQEQYAAIRAIKARFVQKSYLASLDQSEISSGRMFFLKPGRMRWNYESPEEQVFIVRDGIMWWHQPLLKQVIIQEFEKVLISNLPLSFLMGFGNLKNDFVLKEACRNTEGLLLQMAPKDKASSKEDALSSFLALVDESTFLPQGAQVVDVAGNVTSILLRETEVNAADLPESLFSLEVPPGTDICDRRGEERW